MNNMVKGQVGLELVIIIGVMLALMIPTIMYALSLKGEQAETQSTAQAELTVNRIGHSINSVGIAGSGSSIKLEVIIPDYMLFLNSTSGHGIGGTGANKSEIYARIFTGSGFQDLVFITNYNVVNDIGALYAPGKYNIEIASLNSTTVRIRLV
ncbi:hypothetical protein J7J26_00465 [Candidatus Micrarchaeota archaeon]|nr:hypothetical protein [Candidatus Micrarchaeota archaeon]